MSLGLVAYGSSDESDEEDSKASVVINKLQHVDVSVNSKNNNRIVCESDSGLEESVKNSSEHITKGNVTADTFTARSSVSNEVSSFMNDIEDDSVTDDPIEAKSLLSLPAPKTTQLHNIDFDWSRLTKNRSTQPIKITVPALANLESEEDSEPVKKRLKASKTGSGLFALLPSPKHGVLGNKKSSLTPQQVLNSKKPVTTVNKKPALTKLKEVSSSAGLKTQKVLPVSVDDSPDEDEDMSNEKVDFFSLSTPASVFTHESEVHIPVEDVIVSVLNKPINNTKPISLAPGLLVGSKQSINNDHLRSSITPSVHADVAGHSDNSQISGPSYIPFEEEQDLQLDQTAMQQLCARRDRQFGGASVDIIDIKGESILPDAREWMTKQLTEEQNVNIHKHNRKDGPTTQQRRKHQITYLAFQAKEHELELKNQWANNRMSKKQTQAKYGF